MNLRYLDLSGTDPAYNLAMEQYVFDCLPRDNTYWMLWQNDNAIVIGKHQNTLAEINEPYVREHGIRVVRRLSGGGAVYHDMGNLNFTIITDAGDNELLDFHLFCRPVVEVLSSLGVTAEVNGRNDMTIEGRKFSGNAQYLRDGRVMHHGTILFDADLSVVGQALRVEPEKVQSKGIRSVRSRVTNVRPYLQADIDLPQFRRALLRHVVQQNGGSAYDLTPQDLAAADALRRERYDTWAWNYGASPAGTVHRHRRVEGCGSVDIYISMAEGCVSDVSFRGDFFSAREPEALIPRLVGCRPTEEDYRRALEGVDVSLYFAGLDTQTFLDILCT